MAFLRPHTTQQQTLSPTMASNADEIIKKISEAIKQQYDNGIINAAQLNKFYNLIADSAKLKSVANWL